MKGIKRILLILYLFYIIFLPDFGFLTPSLIVVSIGIINSIILNRALISVFKISEVNKVFLAYLTGLVYIFFLNLIGHFEVSNFLSNITAIFQMINFVAAYIWFMKVENTSDSVLFRKYIICVGLIQATLMFLMLIFPSFHQIGQNLLLGGADEADVFVSVLQGRSYGIGSSYTFMLPLVQGIISVLSLDLFFTGSEGARFLFYSLLIIASSALNNRTAIYLYIIIFIIYTSVFILTKQSLKNILLFFISFKSSP